jgi:hypothetical protein
MGEQCRVWAWSLQGCAAGPGRRLWGACFTAAACRTFRLALVLRGIHVALRARSKRRARPQRLGRASVATWAGG